MSKIKLNKVELKNLPNVGVLRVGKTTHTIDLRHKNPGRPVNKQSARYKRLAKQSYYAKQKYECNDDGYGYVCDYNNKHVCNVSYIGRTKVLGYAYVLDRLVKVEINLKQVKFVSQ